MINEIGFGKYHVLFLFSLLMVAISQTLMILSPIYLLQPLSCEWDISPTDSAGIVTASFSGMLLGSLVFASLSDKYGRTKLFKLSFMLALYFSGILILSTSFVWIVFLHVLGGFFLGGSVATIVILMTEVFPSRFREVGVMVMSIFNCLGSIVISLMAHFTITTSGWRYFLTLKIFPVVLALFFIVWLSESPRYLLIVKKKHECLKVINMMATMNGKGKYNFCDIENQSVKNSTFFNEILNKNSLKNIFGMSLICFNCGFSYYGIAMLSYILRTIPHKCLENQHMTLSMPFLNFPSNSSSCEKLDHIDFRTNIIASSSELPVLLMMFFLSRYIGRKLMLIICGVLVSISMFSLNFCYPYLPEICISIARGASVTLFPINDIYGSEIFPTSIRGFTFGISSIFTGSGAIISPFIVNEIFGDNLFFLGSMIFGLTNVFVSIFACILLPETKDKKLLQNSMSMKMRPIPMYVNGVQQSF